jgi:hypothetical protein
MFLNDAPGALVAKPARTALGANPGWYEQNPGGGTGTVVGAEWLNMIQAEFKAILDAAGIVLDKSNDGQVLASLNALYASQPHGFQAVIASGNFVVPAGVVLVDVEIWGAGGGGCSAAQTGGGGSPGGFSRKRVTVTPGQTIACTVPAGGAVDTAGGTTSFGSIFSATGGGRGNNTSPSGAPGAGVGGDFNASGPPGGIYCADGVGGSTPGAGGPSPFGGGGGAMATTGGYPGGGGGGGNAPGGAGLILVKW